MPFLLLLIYYTNVSLILAWILSKFQGGEAVLEGRAEIDTSVLYHNVVDVLFGRGNGVLEHYGMFSSDLRAFSVKYGIISILLLLLAILPVAWQLIKSSQLKNLGVFLLIVMAVAIHRSWMIDTFYLWFFMLVVLLKGFPVKMNKEVASVLST